MKTLTPELDAHLNGEVTSLASCWYICRRDGAKTYLTDHDKDLMIDGNLYRASEGYDRSALKGSSGTDTDEMELSGYLNSDWLSENDLRAGLYDFAEIRLFLVNWQEPTMGIIPLRKGWLGEVSWSDGLFQAELRGLSNAFKRNIGRLYTPECTADLGDNACKVEIEASAVADMVSLVSSRNSFQLTNFEGEDGILNGGIVHFTSGSNLGQKLEVHRWRQDIKQIELFLPCPYDVQPGDTAVFYPGCDKRFVSCRDRYSNQINFRGFPYVPGLDSLLEA
ncbi:hypothetical protein A9Q83_13590 [Alphaproteobacteria bacterium 46_93_T64]|nr:hypothetical protein A9Q83_13590 [Alphaproteobacteria bacterium 46_93_T64]